ncbi:MAG TPA: hypothetical protein DCM73_13390 [Clostridiales bacterium]|nr:hypothetical protein [Clostridiales bacterium]
MKKVLALLLILTMSIFAFVGCAKEQIAPEQQPAEKPAEVPSSEESAGNTADNAVKTGLAVITSVEKSKDATADAEGFGQSDSVVLAVTVDKDGKIVRAAIDTAQTKINFSAEGKVTSDLAAAYKSKQELKEEYGMSKASKLGKEWYEQANVLADYFVGKTAEEIKAIPTDDTGVPTDADLVSSVTIKINGYKEAVEKAVANAKDLGATADDQLGLGISTTIKKSKDAAADAEGQVQAYSTYAVATFNADGKITSSIIDASQANVKFDTAGKITSDLTASVKTKNELQDEYGMRAASKLGKEWYEQADAFTKFIGGKTAEEVKGIALDDEGHSTDADLVSSVTVAVDSFQDVIEEAFLLAK